MLRSNHQLVDGLERAVGLDDGEEYLVESLVLRRAERHREPADVELAGVLDHLQEGSAGRLAADLLERGDREPAHQITLERNEIGRALDRRLIVGDDLE